MHNELHLSCVILDDLKDFNVGLGIRTQRYAVTLLNIVATYGRSLYALVCGLFISRWVLAALGKTDFGLYGVIEN